MIRARASVSLLLLLNWLLVAVLILPPQGDPPARGTVIAAQDESAPGAYVPSTLTVEHLVGAPREERTRRAASRATNQARWSRPSPEIASCSLPGYRSTYPDRHRARHLARSERGDPPH